MLGDRGLELALASGVVDAAGARHRRARVRVPTGREEAWLDEAAPAPGDPATADAVDEVLAAVVARLGGYADVSPELLGVLTRGDRRRLLLAVLAVLEGDELRLAARCPNPDCREVAEVVLSVADVLGPDPVDPLPTGVRVPTADGALTVRAPRAADDRAGIEAAAGWAALVTADDGADPLHPTGLTPDAWARLAPASRAAVAEALAALLDDADPATAAVARCPACGAWIEMDPDPADLLAQALRRAAGRLPAEVHALAYHYGWSEADVLGLPRARRHRYLDLLVRELEGRPLTGPEGWVVS